jgi:DNA-binding protein H-NS
MARPSNLARLSVDELLGLRDQIGAILNKRADDLRSQLSRMGGELGNARASGNIGNGRRGGASVNNGRKKHALSGRKLAPKYRNPKTGESWSGRGMMAGWLKAAMKGGAKKDDFLVTKVAASKKKSAVKRGRRKK